MMAKKYIDADVAIEAIDTIGFDFSDTGLSAVELEELGEAVGEIRQAMIERVKRLPAADVVERKPLSLPEIYVAEEFDTIADGDGNIGFGVYAPVENKIYIAGDVPFEVRAKALFHELAHWIQDMTGNEFYEDEANDFAEKIYEALPSVQPERKKGKWIEYIPEHGKCPYCGNQVDLLGGKENNFCGECGADMRGE